LLRIIDRLLLAVLDSFLTLDAFAGGIGFLADHNAPSLEMLHGSPFTNYTIPGIALFLVVGGTALVAPPWWRVS
jgi:hypothetical protein